ncbi:MAG: RsmE family RNA methyltransferase [Ignavibacteriaceae bacterium]
MEYLSNIELYFTSFVSEDEKYFTLLDDEFHHSTKVMRNKISDKLFATNGKGKIFEGSIEEMSKDFLKSTIIKIYKYQNNLDNIAFCIPNLKNPERLKFAFEKCTELGITNFLLYKPEHSVGKNLNTERLSKITLAAMKQSLRAFLPKIEAINSVTDLVKSDSGILLFEQTASTKLSDFKLDEDKKYIFVFGPEGGFSENEFTLLKDSTKLKLTENRLRSETAILKAASMIT